MTTGHTTFSPARLAGLGALAASLVASVAAPASVAMGATTPRATSAQVSGTVASVDAKAHTFTVKSSSGTATTVKVSSATVYRDSLVTKPSFSSIAVGDSVVAIGTTSKGVETATLVILGGKASGGTGTTTGGGPGGFFGGQGTFGTVTSVDRAKDTFTVKTRTGTKVTVDVTKKTTYRDDAVKKPSFKDVKVGATVVVGGTLSKGTEKATVVAIGRFGGGPGGFGGGTFGTVGKVDRSKDTFTVKTTAGKTVKVKVTKSTTYRNGQSSATFSAVKPGEQVGVTGTTHNGVEDATRVTIGRPGGFGGGTFGTVGKVDRSKDTFTVKTTAGKTVKVKVTKSTTYRNGQSSATFSAVKAGTRVAVIGTTHNGVVTARTVIVGGGFAPPGSGG